MPDIKTDIRDLSHSILSETIDIRRHLHMNPELSFKEYKTSEFVRNYILKLGVTNITSAGGTGLLVHIKGGLGRGKKVVLRAELDALPIEEKTATSYKSRNNGIMHACGHDVHISMLLSTLKILNSLKESIRGDIYFLFQPGEELVPGGASIILNEGVLQNIKPDAIVAQHVLPELDSGKTGFKPGKYMASSDEIYIDITGKGGHAALPGKSTDQILIAANLIGLLKSEVKIVAGKEPVAFAFGKFIADGATNIIPSKVHIEGTLRTFNEKLRSDIHTLLHNICKKSIEKHVAIDLEIRRGYPVLENNPEITSRAIATAREVNGSDTVEILDTRLSSEDFAFYSQLFPVVFYRIGVKSPEGKILDLHTSTFDIHEPAMEIGIRTLASIAIDLLAQ